MDYIESADNKKKQLLLRLSPTLWNELAVWASEDFRSINGQIEYLLSECVKRRKKVSKASGGSVKDFAHI